MCLFQKCTTIKSHVRKSTIKNVKKLINTVFLTVIVAVSSLALLKTDAYALGGQTEWKEWDTHYQNFPNEDCVAYLVANENGGMYSTNTSGHVHDFMASYPSDKRFRHRFVLQADGNLVLYRHAFTGDKNGYPVWATNTAGSGANRFVVQNDGNMVLYRPNGSVAWASNTQYINNGSTWTILLLQGDGNLVMYNFYFNINQGWYVVPVWATGTNA